MFCIDEMSSQDLDRFVEDFRQKEWLQILKMEWVNDRFAHEARDRFGGFPSVALLRALWDTEWGQGVRDHFSIDELQPPKEMWPVLEAMKQQAFRETLGKTTLKF